MYTLEEIEEKANAQGWRAFRIWFFIWMVLMALFVLFAAAKNPDLHWYEIAIDEWWLFAVILFSSFMFYGIGAAGARNKMKEENKQEEQLQREEHYKKMEELLEKMSKNNENDD